VGNLIIFIDSFCKLLLTEKCTDNPYIDGGSSVKDLLCPVLILN